VVGNEDLGYRGCGQLISILVYRVGVGILGYRGWGYIAKCFK